MIVSLIALALAAAPKCVPTVGADRLWGASVHYVLIGELHGTVETPAAFTDLACLAAAARRRVTVALEFDANFQPQVNAFLASDGGTAARAALLRLPIWHEGSQDGRSSTATLALFERLRRMRRAGAIDAVVCADPDTRPGETRDAAIARAWQAAPLRDDGLLLALAGNVHTMRKTAEFRGRTIVTAGSLLPRDRTVTVDVRNNGGTAWTCQADGCGVHPIGRPRSAQRGVTFVTDAAEAWDAVLELGVPTTAAMPAIPSAPAPPPLAVKLDPA